MLIGYDKIRWQYFFAMETPIADNWVMARWEELNLFYRDMKWKAPFSDPIIRWRFINYFIMLNKSAIECYRFGCCSRDRVEKRKAHGREEKNICLDDIRLFMVVSWVSYFSLDPIVRMFVTKPITERDSRNLTHSQLSTWCSAPRIFRASSDSEYNFMWSSRKENVQHVAHTSATYNISPTSLHHHESKKSFSYIMKKEKPDLIFHQNV